MAYTIVLHAPSTPNLKELADSTSWAFKLLRPWCKSEHSSLSLRSIKHQAQAYANAIDLSVIAAQDGFTVAEDVLSFSTLINEDNRTTEADRQGYLRQMLEIGHRGEQNALRVHSGFRDVRVKVLQLITNAKKEHSQGGSNVVPGGNLLHDLEKSLVVLENFSTSISNYISWWNMMNMSHFAQNARLGCVLVDYNSLRCKEVVKKWKDLKQEYLDYANQIKAIQDTDPQFWADLAKARAEGDPVPPTTFPEELGIDTPCVSPAINLTRLSSSQPDPTAMLFMPISFLNIHPQDCQPLRKRDRLLQFAHRLSGWQSIAPV